MSLANIDPPPAVPAAVPTVTRPVAIQRVNPIPFGDELKTFMAEEGHPAFADFFDRAYEGAVREGATCWFGRDPSQRLVMSITAFVHVFRHRDREIRAAVLGNFMAARTHRTFFPALGLMKRVLADLRDAGDIDLMYGDPNESASAIMKAARLEHVDDLDRMVLPVADARWMGNIAARLYTAFTRLRAGRVARAVVRSPDDRTLAEFAEPLGAADRLLPYRRGTVLRRRLAGFTGEADHLVELRLDARSPAWDALVLLRGPDPLGIVQIVAIQRSPALKMRAIVPPLVSITRRIGGRRLQIVPLRKGRFARECAGAGLIHRGVAGPIFARAFTSAGADELKDLELWELTSTDMER